MLHCLTPGLGKLRQHPGGAAWGLPATVPTPPQIQSTKSRDGRHATLITKKAKPSQPLGRLNTVVPE